MDAPAMAAMGLLETVHAALCGPAAPLLLAGTGLWLSLRTGWVQLRCFPQAMMQAFVPPRGEKKARHNAGGARSAWETVSAALAGTVGTGNIAGVAGAMLAGGPGAVFWMWVSAFFGMCTKYTELLLAARFRSAGGGGPMYYIEAGLGRRWRWLAVWYALGGALAGFGIGNLVQGHEITGALEGLFGMPRPAAALLLTAAAGLVVLGGAERIIRASALVVPAMSGLYLLAGIAAALLRPQAVPRFFSAVVSGAFQARAAGGGLLGILLSPGLREGFARGVFSNEAGLGSAAIAHGTAGGTDPRREALWGIFEVFADTFVICTVTAFLVFASGVAETPGGAASFPSGGAAAAEAFSRLFSGRAGAALVRVLLVLFAFSTILGWCYYGQCCFRYLFRGSRGAEGTYRLLFLLALPLGSVPGGSGLLLLAETMNMLMALPNLLALLLLSDRAAEPVPILTDSPWRTSARSGPPPGRFRSGRSGAPWRRRAGRPSGPGPLQRAQSRPPGR